MHSFPPSGCDDAPCIHPALNPPNNNNKQCADINQKEASTPRIFLSTSEARPTSLYKDDIDGSTPRNRTHRRGTKAPAGEGQDAMSSDDISKQLKRLPWKIEETTRKVDPLNPTYRFNVPKGAPPDWCFGPVEGSKSTRFYTGAKHGDTPGKGHGGGDTSYSAFMMRTGDIEGASTDTKGRFVSRTSPFYRTTVNRSNYNDDVEGARPGGAFTLLPKHIVVKRAAAATAGGGGRGGLGRGGSPRRPPSRPGVRRPSPSPQGTPGPPSRRGVRRAGGGGAWRRRGGLRWYRGPWGGRR